MGSRRHSGPLGLVSPNIITTNYSLSKVTATHDDVQEMFKHQPENESQSGSSSSHFDALEEDDTDDSFSRRMIREMRARNQEGVENARSAHPQAFRKARPRGRGRLTLENLERIPVNRDVEELQSSQGSTRSASSGGASTSDPPLNVPREWGRKGKRSSDWLRRIKMDPAQQTPRPDAAGDVDWLQAASDVPIPSAEDSPLSHRGSTRGTPASSLRRQNESRERIQALELNESLDLTNQSFITSTPAITRNTALAEIRQRELDTGLDDSESVYATPPIGGSQALNRNQNRLSITRTKQTTNLATWSHPAEQEIQPTKRTGRVTTSNTVLTNSRPRGPPSPISLHKSSHTLGSVDLAITPTIQQSPKRPEHRREDSQDILRRLSRATSGTPSPGRVMINSSVPDPGKETVGRIGTKGKEAPLVPLPEADTQKDTAGQGRGAAKSRVHFESSTEATNRDATAKASTHATTQRRPIVVDETLISTPRLDPKTPIVTGAWVDTPKPAQRQDPIPPASPAKRAAAAALGIPVEPIKTTQPSQPAEPALPSSALAAVVDEARQHLGQENAEDLGEATINSLEDLMAPHPEDSMLDDEDDTIDLQLPSRSGSTDAQWSRRVALQSAKSLSETAEDMYHNIRSARKAADRMVATQVRASSPTIQQSPCYNCTHLFPAMWRQSKALFYTREERKTRPTKAGWLLLILLTWIIAEVIMA
jgi:hypothetical protein